MIDEVELLIKDGLIKRSDLKEIYRSTKALFMALERAMGIPSSLKPQSEIKLEQRIQRIDSRANSCANGVRQ